MTHSFPTRRSSDVGVRDWRGCNRGKTPPRADSNGSRQRVPGRQPWYGRDKSSAAGDAHVAGDRRLLAAAVDDEVVALGLAADRPEDRGVAQRVSLALAHRRARAGGVPLAHAHGERSGAGPPNAGAALTDVRGNRRAEAEERGS